MQKEYYTQLSVLDRDDGRRFFDMLHANADDRDVGEIIKSGLLPTTLLSKVTFPGIEHSDIKYPVGAPNFRSAIAKHLDGLKDVLDGSVTFEGEQRNILVQGGEVLIDYLRWADPAMRENGPIRINVKSVAKRILEQHTRKKDSSLQEALFLAKLWINFPPGGKKGGIFDAKNEYDNLLRKRVALAIREGYFSEAISGLNAKEAERVPPRIYFHIHKEEPEDIDKRGEKYPTDTEDSSVLVKYKDALTEEYGIRTPRIERREKVSTKTTVFYYEGENADETERRKKNAEAIKNSIVGNVVKKGKDVGLQMMTPTQADRDNSRGLSNKFVVSFPEGAEDVIDKDKITSYLNLLEGKK